MRAARLSESEPPAAGRSASRRSAAPGVAGRGARFPLRERRSLTRRGGRRAAGLSDRKAQGRRGPDVDDLELRRLLDRQGGGFGSLEAFVE
jgi:hypothetical protein